MYYLNYKKNRNLYMNIKISDEALHIIEKMNSSGFRCYAVGGCVRDILMNKEPYDYDFTTDARPNEIEECFKDYLTYDVGKKFGTVAVLLKHTKFEITTFRSDGKYSDNRHPDSVYFSDKLSDDLKRRDFTVNAMAYHPNEGLIDLYSSVSDLKNRIIRCVGDPDERFREDALRILRALRFSSKLNFRIDHKTGEAIHRNRLLLKNVAIERISAEFLQILTGNNAEYILMEYRDVFEVFIPEIKVMFDFDQKSLHHCYDLWEHTVKTVANIDDEETLRTAMFFHDIGKAHTQSIDDSGHAHYRGHPSVSAYIAKPVLKRLCFSNSFIKETLTLIEYHDVRFNGRNSVIRETLRRIGPDMMEKLLKVQRADMMSQSLYNRDIKVKYYNLTKGEFDYIIKTDQCYSLRQMKITGQDIIDIGITDGNTIGQLLDLSLTAVIKGIVKNSKPSLLRYAQQQYKNLTKNKNRI